MTQTEALRLALEALEYRGTDSWRKRQPAITAIKAALEAKDEPVAYINVEHRKLEWAKYVSWGTPTVVNLPKIPLYTTSPQRTWVGLVDTDIGDEYVRFEIQGGFNRFEYAVRAIEAKLKEKNT
jgi:hypothetical protein